MIASNTKKISSNTKLTLNDNNNLNIDFNILKQANRANYIVFQQINIKFIQLL